MANIIIKEIEDLKNRTDIHLKIIESSGDVTHILNISFKDIEGNLKIQIPKQYPNEIISAVVINCNNKTINHVASSQLSTLTERLRGTACLNAIVDAAKHSLLTECHVIQTNVSKNLTDWQEDRFERIIKQKRNKINNKKTCEKKIQGKKPPMKTASDVVNRIQWDEDIDKDHITIGYVDRFRGVLEKQWQAFSWEDIASVDYYTFVVPRHRISYFKWKRALVWDKKSRTDNVFGSTGSNITIYDVIKNYRDEDYIDKSNQLDSESNNPASIEEEADINATQELENDFSDSDDDDNFVVTIRREEFNHKSSVALSDFEDDEDDYSTANIRPALLNTKQDFWEDKCRPNFFICVRVCQPEVLTLVNHIQDEIVRQEPRLTDCCIPQNMLHMTLLTLRLNDAEDVATCLQVLHEAREELQASLPKTPLRIAGTGCFFGRVLYARVEADNSFYKFNEHLRVVVSASGLRIMDQHEFVAHMTLLKTTRAASRALGTRIINPQLFVGTENLYFGEQLMDTLYLCSMEKERGPDGFYMSPGGLQFMREIL